MRLGSTGTWWLDGFPISRVTVSPSKAIDAHPFFRAALLWFGVRPRVGAHRARLTRAESR